MVTNPFEDKYRRLIDSPPPAGIEREDAWGGMMVDLYYALDEALERIENLQGAIYELEQTLEGLLDAAHDHKEVVPYE